MVILQVVGVGPETTAHEVSSSKNLTGDLRLNSPSAYTGLAVFLVMV
ncbi:hypothetical protein ACFWYW_57305 [Nonomuraea sp. NPDC059023]